MVTGTPLHFGVFITPFHPIGQSPTVALEYDMERVVALDRLGFDEAWFGEHHSGGYELIACPEVFIAAAASGPNTSGWAPGWCRCHTTIRSWWPTAGCCWTT